MLVILLTVLLDAVGIGLIMPILPALLRSLGGLDAGSVHYGALLAAYALMQFLFSPILGALSDRFGRRPVLLISLAGAAADYLLMAFAPTLAGSIWGGCWRASPAPTWRSPPLTSPILPPPASARGVSARWARCSASALSSGRCSADRWANGICMRPSRRRR